MYRYEHSYICGKCRRLERIGTDHKIADIPKGWEKIGHLMYCEECKNKIYNEKLTGAIDGR